MQRRVSQALLRMNITGMEKGAFAALLGEAHEHLVTAALMRLGFPVSVMTVRGETYDLIIPVYENFDQDKEKRVLIRAQVRTIRKRLRLVGGLRAGVNRKYLRGVKVYKYTTEHNDLIIAVDQDTLDLYLIPTRYIGRWGSSVGKGRLQPLKNRFDILLNWRDDYLARLEALL